MVADEFRSVGAGVVDDASGNLLAVRPDNRDHIAVLELVLDSRHSRMEETGVLPGNRVERAFIDMDSSGDRRSKGNPAALSGERLRFADEQCAFLLAVQNPRDDAWLQTICDDGHTARIHRDSGG